MRKKSLPAFKYYLPFDLNSTFLIIGDLKGDVSLSIGKHVQNVIILLNSFKQTRNIAKRINEEKIKNIQILVGDPIFFPINKNCISSILIFNFKSEKKSFLDLINNCYDTLTNNSFLYYSFETSQWASSIKWKMISAYRKPWLKKGFKSKTIVAHYLSFLDLHFVQAFKTKDMWKPKILYFYLKQLFFANTWGEIISISNNQFSHKKNIPFIERIKDHLYRKQGNNFQKLIKLWISSTGSIVAEFEKGIIRLPIDSFSHEKIENNYIRLKKLKMEESIIPAPKPIAKGICLGQIYYAETKIYGTPLDHYNINDKKSQIVIKQAFDLLINHTKLDIISSNEYYNKFIKAYIFKFSSFLKEEDRKYLYEFYAHSESFFLKAQFNLALVHGDFKYSNFIISKERKANLIGVIDWEHSKDIGLPFYDLLTLLAYNVKPWSNSDKSTIGCFWDIVNATEVNPMIFQYFEIFHIDLFLLKPLCLICMIIHLHIFYIPEIKEDGLYEKMISSCLIPSTIKVINFLRERRLHK